MKKQPKKSSNKKTKKLTAKTNRIKLNTDFKESLKFLLTPIKDTK
jgi:hypothetical protein